MKASQDFVNDDLRVTALWLLYDWGPTTLGSWVTSLHPAIHFWPAVTRYRATLKGADCPVAQMALPGTCLLFTDVITSLQDESLIVVRPTEEGEVAEIADPLDAAWRERLEAMSAAQAGARRVAREALEDGQPHSLFDLRTAVRGALGERICGTGREAITRAVLDDLERQARRILGEDDWVVALQMDGPPREVARAHGAATREADGVPGQPTPRPSLHELLEGKRTVEPVLVAAVTLGARYSFPVSWRSYPCPKANPVILTRNSIGDT
jgi:hypothetical protein